MEAAECGAAALSIILSYYGCFVPLEEVRLMCSVSRDGSNAFNMIKAAEYYGLEGAGFSAELTELYGAKLPFIAYWGFDHFVVIEGFSKHSVFINDPDSGPRTISYEEFNECFTGVILTFSPTPLFKKTPRDKRRYWFSLLWKRFKFFRMPLLFSLIIGFIAIIPLLALTVLSQIFIDDILIGRIYSWSAGVLIGIAAMALFSTAIYFLQHWILIRFSVNLSTLLSGQFVWHTLRLPILFFLQRYGGEIASRISLNKAVADTWVSEFLPAIVNIVFAFIFAFIMFYYDAVITIAGISIVLINLWMMKHLYRSREDAYANYRQIQGRMTSFAINGLSSIESLKAVGGEQQFISRYGGIYTRSLNTLQNMAYADLMLGTFSPFLSMLGSLTVLVLGAYRIIQGYLTIGEFFALQMLFQNFTTPVLNLVNLNQTLQILRINLLRIDDVMRHQEDPLLQHSSDLSASAPIDQLRGNVEVKDLTYGYGPLDPPVLKEVQFKLAAGTCVALVGPTGCGKSTLAKLIGGLLPPRSGDILFDGVSHLLYPREALTRSIAVVEQSSFLFEDTVQHNISLMDTMPNQKGMIQASQDACIHDDILLRPGGYQSLVEKRGANFSGGQRQRLEIACALNRNPSILILDEATSAIDSITEEKLLRNIRRRGRTCLIITHRLKTVRNCDLILIMDKGRIVQQGTHETLIQQPGLYQSLSNDDAGGADEI